MRILFAHLYDTSFKMGGAEKVLLDIALAMKAKYGEEVACVVNRGDLSGLLEDQRIPVSDIEWSKSKTFKTLSVLKRRINEFQPDIVHSHHRYTTFLLDLFLKNKCRILHTEHVLRQDKKMFFRPGHLCNGVHESVEKNLVNYYGVKPQQARTIPNAVSVAPPRENILSDLKSKYRKDKILSLFIGRMEEQKGHTYLVKAVAKMPEAQRNKIHFLLAGDGGLSDEVSAEMKQLGVQDSFTLLGHTPYIPELLALCDFLILPSLFEGMPLSLLEAYDAGKMVIATDIPGSRELVRNGQTGFLAQPKDPASLAEAILKVVDNPETISRMSMAAKQLSEQEYSFNTMMQRYHDLYQEMIRTIHAR